MKSKILLFTVVLLSVVSAQAKPLPVSVKSHEGTFTLQSPSIAIKAEGVAPLSMMLLQGGNIVVSMLGGDGVASYKVDWIIDIKKQEVQRFVFDGENESSDVSRALAQGPWLKLKEIPAPKTVVLTTK